MRQTLKKIYHLIPFKKEIFSLIRIFKPSERIYKHLHFKGVFNVRVKDSYFRINHYGYSLENQIFWSGLHGDWEANSISLWIKLVQTSSVVFDIGANTGVYSLIAGAVNPRAEIISFEPVERIFDKLESNVKLNKFNIKPSKIAISNSNGEANFYDNDEDHNYSASLNAGHRPGSMAKKVITQTLDSFIEQHGVKPELVKIDVERHEPAVIEGFIGHIREYHPTILIEILDSVIGSSIEELLSGMPYRYYAINEQKGIRKVDTLKDREDYNFLICTEEVARKLNI